MIKVLGIVLGLAALYLALSFILRTWAGASMPRQMAVGAGATAVAFLLADHLIGAPATWPSAFWSVLVGAAAGSALPIVVSSGRALLSDHRGDR
ncbi:MAG: hypothetical protein AAFR35_12285 [Pseudomonadota bacterium]